MVRPETDAKSRNERSFCKATKTERNQQIKVFKNYFLLKGTI